jgi:hypothetical protein
MEYNLLMKEYSEKSFLFLIGEIPIKSFRKIKYKYMKNKKLFTINLN